MTATGEVRDPETNTPMKPYGFARRKFIEPHVESDPRVFHVWVPVYVNPETGRHHRVLPDFLLPFKHYTVQSMEAVIEADEDTDICDYPCESTKRNWISQFADFWDSLVAHLEDAPSLVAEILGAAARRLTCAGGLPVNDRYRDPFSWVACLVQLTTTFVSQSPQARISYWQKGGIHAISH